jgi:hypothetical protein
MRWLRFSGLLVVSIVTPAAFGQPTAAPQDVTVDTSDPLAPLRGRIDVAGQEWQRVNTEVKRELRQAKSNCDPRISSNMDRLRKAMRAYFDAQRFYVVRWDEFVAEQNRRIASNDAGSEEALRRVAAMRQTEEQDLAALEKRLESMRRNSSATAEVVAEGENLKAQILSMRQDLDHTAQLVDATRRSAGAQQEFNRALAASLKERLGRIETQAKAWDGSYDQVLSTYESRCYSGEKK